MKPKDPSRPASHVARAALRLGVGARGVSTLVHYHGVQSFSERAALLVYLTSSAAFRPFSQIWLTPRSPGDWAQITEPLLAKGWRIGVTLRYELVTTIKIYSPGASFDPSLSGDEDESARLWLWSGRSAAGVIDVPAGLSSTDECRATLDAIEDVDAALRARHPAVTLGTSLTGTSLSIFRTLLTREIEADPQLEVTLRQAGATQGGRQEMFAPVGAVALRAEAPDHEGELQPIAGFPQPCDLDLISAYPTALETTPIGAAFTGEGSESQATDPLSIVSALVEVPENLRIAPLRYEPSSGGSACYPTGVFLGAWSGIQLRAAIACGATIKAVHTVWRFAEDEVFARFGEAMSAWRRELASQDSPVASACKALAVRGVGAWQMAPRLTETFAGPPPLARMAGARPRGHGLWEVACAEEQHRNALLPAGIQTVGAVQAWAALVLHAADRERAHPIYWHTDGGAFRDADALLRALLWAERHGAPPLASWRLRELLKIQVWAPGQRLELYTGGLEKVAGAGLSRHLERDVLLARGESVESLAAVDRAEAGRRLFERGISRAPRLEDIDPECATLGRAVA